MYYEIYPQKVVVMCGTEHLMKSRFLDRQIRCEVHENHKKSNLLPVFWGQSKKDTRAIGKITNAKPPVRMESSTQN